MYVFFAVLFGVMATVSAAYLAYWKKKRFGFHILPYVLAGAAILFFSLEFQRLDWVGALITFCLIAGLHIVSFFSENLKR